MRTSEAVVRAVCCKPKGFLCAVAAIISQDWHRHDDERCFKDGHIQPCSPDTAPFRCIGYDCEAPELAALVWRACTCPDFIG